MPPAKHNQTGNRLLDRFPEHEYRRLAPLLETVSLSVKQPLYRINEPISHAYFPLGGFAGAYWSAPVALERAFQQRAINSKRHD